MINSNKMYTDYAISLSEEGPDAAHEGVREKDPAPFEPRSQQDEQQHVREIEKMKKKRFF